MKINEKNDQIAQMMYILFYYVLTTLMALTLVLAIIGFHWLHMAASNYQSVLHKINPY